MGDTISLYTIALLLLLTMDIAKLVTWSSFIPSQHPKKDTSPLFLFYFSTLVLLYMSWEKEAKCFLCPVLRTEGKIGSFHMVCWQHARWFLWGRALVQEGAEGSFLASLQPWWSSQAPPMVLLRPPILQVPDPLSSPRPPPESPVVQRNVFTFRTLSLKPDWLPSLKQKFGLNRAYPERHAWL